MTTIQPRARNGSDEELGSVRVGSAVGHGQEARTVMLQGEVLIRETIAVDGLASHTITHREISSLKMIPAHKLDRT